MSAPARDKQKWLVRKWRCRFNYQDGCHPAWMVTAPDDAWQVTEFATWSDAIKYVNTQVAVALAVSR